jgi:hypothetical protein
MRERAEADNHDSRITKTLMGIEAATEHEDSAFPLLTAVLLCTSAEKCRLARRTLFLDRTLFYVVPSSG